ncbi:MAG: tetratricopeptide repeat protein [Acidobacteria bacterium]|nr:tetratricopeptide repeat protein [Acidobacteriota bacterium]MBI3278509.1 tetratricopeptide repeat protein [Acidobacteriota bacterium]
MRAIKLLLLSASALAQNDALIEGLKQFQAGNYAAAEASLAKAQADPRGRAFLALTRAATSRCRQAAAELADQFEKNTDAEVRRLTGIALVQCQLGGNRIDEAQATAAKLRAAFPNDADVLYQLARLHMRAWNDIVYEMFQKAPASFRVNQISAEIFETQANYPAAIAEYRKAIEKNPRALNLHFRLGRALLLNSHAREALAQALQEFEAELALNPHDAAAEYQIGQILTAQQKPAEAARRYQRALELAPDFPEALLALGKWKLTERRNDEAITLLERSVRMLPRSEAARYSLMMAYRNAGRTADALREKAELEKLQKPPEGEFTEFLKKLGEKKPE